MLMLIAISETLQRHDRPLCNCKTLTHAGPSGFRRLRRHQLEIEFGSGVMGVPCNGKECADQFWEHHAFIYYGLLQKQDVV